MNEQFKYIESNCSFDGKSIIFVSEKKFEEIKQEYVKNKNNKIKYEYIEEPKIDINDELEDLADNIFGTENIIVEEE